jgi:hypothetical protein
MAADVIYQPDKVHDFVRCISNGTSSFRDVHSKLDNVLNYVSSLDNGKPVVLDLTFTNDIGSPQIRIFIKYHKFLSLRKKPLYIIANPETHKCLYSTPFAKEANLFHNFESFEKKRKHDGKMGNDAYSLNNELESISRLVDLSFRKLKLEPNFS